MYINRDASGPYPGSSGCGRLRNRTIHKWRPFDGNAHALSSSTSNLLCVCVRLHHTEQVSFRVFAVGEISHSRNRSLRHDQLASGFCYRGDGSIHGIHTQRVRRVLHVSALHQAAIDSRRFLVASVDQPIVHWSRPLFDLPAEHVFVEFDGAIGIVDGNFKMNYARHNTSPFSPGLPRKSSWRLRLFRLRRGAVPLGSPPNDHAHDAPRQNYFQVITVLHDGHNQSQHETDANSEENSQRHRIYFSCENSRSHACDQALNRRAENNSDNHSPYGGREPSRPAVNSPKQRPEQQTNQNLIHRGLQVARFSPALSLFTTSG